MMGISSTGTQGCVYLTKPWEKKLSGIPFFANFAITMSRRHYRLDFIAENTFNRVWSLRMSRPRVFLAAGACIAAVAALIFVLLAYTPLRQLMPGALHGDLRSRYIETALRVDSLENKVRINRAYIDNIATIMRGDDTDTLAYSDGMAAIELPSDADSLLAAGEAERDFVRRYSDEVVIMTDDGSAGTKGLVTAGVEDVIKREKVSEVVAIGPAVMMKFVALLTKKYEIPTIC